MTAAFHPSERKIIKSLLLKKFGNNTVFFDQLRSIKKTERKFTGTGYYLEFADSAELWPVDHLNEEVTEGFRTTLPSPQDMVGFTLFIRKGRMSWLEGYTYGDVAWPDKPIAEWLIFDPVERQHQRAK